MSESPFAFFRGAAKIMAADLAATPATGLTAQICGDAHLGNFGSYAAPDRGHVFDLNDFDETLPGPWEWDLKRLATSFVVAGRDNELDAADIRPVAMKSVAAYREAMAEFAEGKTMRLSAQPRSDLSAPSVCRYKASKELGYLARPLIDTIRDTYAWFDDRFN